MPPEEKKTVKFPVWDQETDEIIELEMDADDYEAMCKAEDEAYRKLREGMDYAYEQDRAAWEFIRDD